MDSDQEIQVAAHTMVRALERGIELDEIMDVIRTGQCIPAKGGRYGKVKVLSFHSERKGKFYEQKKVEVYYTVENNIIITITAYAFYGKWVADDADSI